MDMRTLMINLLMKNALIIIGDWQLNEPENDCFTSFENFDNMQLGQITENIDGEVWHLFNVVSGNTDCDKKVGTTSARCVNFGYLESDKYFANLELISFYIGLANNSDNRGLRKYSVAVSSNGINWTSILNNHTSVSQFDFVQIDIKQMLLNGLWLNEGFLADISTPLRVKISFDGSAPSGSERLYNLDELTIKCNA